MGSRMMIIKSQKTRKLSNLKIENCVLKFHRNVTGIDKGIGRGKGEPPAPETEKMLKKSGVISEGSIFSNKFSKNN